MKLFATLIAAMAVSAQAATEGMRWMERSVPRSTFVKQIRSDPERVHELVFAVKQNNLNKVHNILMDISNPHSAKYQQWLTYDQIGELTSNPAATSAVEQWLKENNVEIKKTSKRGEYITASTTISRWEALLDAEFFEWQDQTQPSQKQRVDRATEYSVPESIQPYLHAVFKSVQTPPASKPKYHRKRVLDVAEGAVERDVFKTNLRVNMDANNKHTASQNVVNVAFLDSYYGIPSANGNSALSQSVFETSSEYFSPDDLKDFQQEFNLPVQAAVVENGYSTTNCVQNDCYEGNLDVQYIMGVAQNIATIYWYVSGNDPFVDYITEIVDDQNPPQANSISWGSNEQDNSASEMSSFDTEALKLTAMGVTVTVSSGDDGAPNTGYVKCMCTDDSSSDQFHWSGTNTWTGEGYFPSYPATSPYVTAVGATQGPESGNEEIVCQSSEGGVITSGGGFSTFYAQPTWQTDAVNAYFNGLTTSTTPTSGYNSQGRAYPDVSMIGVWYEVMVQGQIVDLFGTSASSPVFAAMISLVNSARYTLGQPSVGFINPTLYQLGSNATFAALHGNAKFNDVTSGDNKCCASSTGHPTCCDSGFTAVPGWDPTTGWGSINYEDLANVFSVAGVNGGGNTSSSSNGGAGSDDDAALDAGVTAAIVIVVLVVVAVAVGIFFWAPWKPKSNAMPPNAQKQQGVAVAGQQKVVANPINRDTFSESTPNM